MLCCVAVAAGVAMTVQRPVGDVAYLVLDAVGGVAFPLPGALLATRRPRNPLGWLFCLAGSGLAAQALAGGYAVHGGIHGWAGTGWAAWTANWVFFLGFGPLFLLPILLPDGRPPSPRWRPAVTALVLALAVLQVLLMFRDRTWLWGREEPSRFGFIPTPFLTVSTGIVISALAVAGVGALAVRIRRAEDRRQLLPVLAAAVVIALSTVVTSVWADPVWAWLDVLTLPLLPVATAVSILRYRLFDVELLLRRTFVYALVTALLLGAYLVTVATVRTLLGWGGDLLATAVVAVAFSPARAAVQRAVGRLLFGDRGDPASALSQLGQRLEASAEPTRLLDGAAETVARTLRLPSVAVLAADGTPVSVFGGVPAEGARLALQSGGHEEGELRAAYRSRGEELSRADLAVLGDLARHLAVALAAVRLAGEVQESRERLVLAREEERRRLRRDLHDGLGPGLAAIGVRLDLIAAGAPAALREPLAEVGGLTRELVGDVRRIVHDLRPSALDELGLDGALEDLTLDLDGEAAVSVEIGRPLPELPAAVEVAAYRIAQEALTNAVKHAGASRIGVAVSTADGDLVLRIHDDGRGLPGTLVEGVGSSSMRERAAELGGTLTRTSGPGGGTTVEAVLPLGRPLRPRPPHGEEPT